MDKNSTFKMLASDVGKGVQNLFDKSKDVAMKAVDQNDDGQLDFSDVTSAAENVKEAMKKSSKVIKEGIEEKAREIEKKSLQPLFPDTLNSADFLMPKFIRVTDRDKKHAESKVCQGSIGFISDEKELSIVNVFKDSIDVFGLAFYPDDESEFYYVDPSDRDRYIALNDYFTFLKTARIAELQKIAQDLGAKHFKVTYKEEKSVFSEKKITAHGKAMIVANGQQERKEREFSKVDIAAEMTFPGHEPIKPKLHYLQREPLIQNLITLRMNEETPLLQQTLSLNLSNSSGMKESDAAKIDAVLKGMKCSGNASVSSEAQNESRRYLEYEIEF
ncbi:MAG: hypothetical protein ACI39H_03765 [Lachnospiraceae bacterium]